MMDSRKEKPELYTWNEWAIFIVSTIKSLSDDNKRLELRVEELEKEIYHLKELKIGKAIDEFNIFQSSMKVRIGMIAVFISVLLAIGSMLISIFK